MKSGQLHLNIDKDELLSERQDLPVQEAFLSTPEAPLLVQQDSNIFPDAKESVEDLADVSKLTIANLTAHSSTQTFSEQFNFSGPYQQKYEKFFEKSISPFIKILEDSNKSEEIFIKYLGGCVHSTDKSLYFQPTPIALANAGLFLNKFFSNTTNLDEVEKLKLLRNKSNFKETAAPKCISFISGLCTQFSFCLIGLSHQHEENDEQLRTAITATCDELNKGMIKFYLAPKASENTHLLISKALIELNSDSASQPQRTCAEKSYISVLVKIGYLSPQILGSINCSLTPSYPKRDMSKDMMEVTISSDDSSAEAKKTSKKEYYIVKKNCEDCQTNYKGVMLLLSAARAIDNKDTSPPTSPLSKCGLNFFSQISNQADLKAQEITAQLINSGKAKNEKQLSEAAIRKQQIKKMKKNRRLIKKDEAPKSNLLTPTQDITVSSQPEQTSAPVINKII